MNITHILVSEKISIILLWAVNLFMWNLMVDSLMFALTSLQDKPLIEMDLLASSMQDLFVDKEPLVVDLASDNTVS